MQAANRAVALSVEPEVTILVLCKTSDVSKNVSVKS